MKKRRRRRKKRIRRPWKIASSSGPSSPGWRPQRGRGMLGASNGTEEKRGGSFGSRIGETPWICKPWRRTGGEEEETWIRGERSNERGFGREKEVGLWEGDSFF